MRDYHDKPLFHNGIGSEYKHENQEQWLERMARSKDPAVREWAPRTVNPFECSICHKLFKTRRKVKRHKIDEHSY
jgi:hypothetical protein